MKANEMMIGDFVYAYETLSDNLTQRVAIRVESVSSGLTFTGEGGKYCDYDNAYPIPLTEEILKANGFKKLDLTIGNYALKLEEKEKYDIHTILWGGVFNGRMEFKVICEYIHIDKKIRYVHELQHALRLCGLHELANNLQIE